MADDGPDRAVEVGVKFRADVNGVIAGIRFYKSAANTGTHVGNLWTRNGVLLATATFTGETASGWQQANFAAPVAIAANTVYVASYHTDVGHYAADQYYFATSGVDSPPLHALAAGVSGPNGVYSYGANSKFPNSAWRSANYWVDVVFVASAVIDATPPVVTSFAIPAASSSLTVAITSFSATDNVGVTGYMVTESAAAPSGTAGGWLASPPASYTFATAGSKTLYGWAKDAANNVSAPASAPVTITLPDTTAPTVTAFSIPATSSSLTVPITSFSATDNVGVTGYMVTESAAAPSGTAGGWLASPPASYTFGTAGSKTLYGWAKDAANNVSAPASAPVTITLPDTTAPTVTAFSIPATSSSLTVPITSFSATDNVGVTGYMVTESAAAPSGTAGGWLASPPASYTFATAGSKTLYGWAKDAANNVSAPASAPVTITLPDSTAPTVTAFAIPATSSSLTVPITSFSATDNVGVTGYMVTESAAAPSGTAGGWLASPPASYTFATAGSKTLYAWAKDAANNVSAPASAPVTITLPDTTAPTVTAFAIPATSSSLTVPITSFSATDNVGVTGYMMTESAAAPSGTGGGWLASPPASYTFATAGSKTLYAWAKDAANNVSASLSATVTITLADTTPPTVTSFSIPATSTSLTVTIISFTATDNTGVTGYVVTESAAAPSATGAGWSATPPASYTFATAGAKTLYAWAKDAANNVSAGLNASVTITLPDTTPPTVTAFSVPATSTSLTVTITAFTATDDVAVTGYMVTESAAAPSATGAGWSATPPASYTFATAGAKTLYAWAKDAANNVSASLSAPVTVTLPDTTAPTVTAFTLPSTSTTLTVAITSFTASDNVGVTGYIATESATAPSATGTGWSATAPLSYTFATAGSKTLYGWAKDAANNVSASRSAAVVITIPTVPETAGWYAGDMHVHRSCGGSPEALSSLQTRMSTENLSVISVLADMGNAEVQNATTDLPLVNGQDASISTPGRIVHWDAEWHWDPTYTQYPHQALGGHLVALGLNQAQQLWQEYTYPILDWIQQHNGIGGFAHMQYLDGGIPTSLTCCTPIEYPVEVALGSAKFISEDVDDVNSGFSMYPENAIQAYYKLLNTGFRPGLAAGTDYPCNSSRPLGSLLTYVQTVNGQLTYRNWIEGIAAGRTVVSRNGHREFLQLTVNGSATPGDEIQLAAAAGLPVTVQWTATQSYSGTIELVSNGVVVASRTASVAAGSPVTWSTTVDFPKSGWVAARRMGTDGHQVHTAAVFVIVNNAPIRASAADAQFFVQWMDSLLTMTSRGGSWNYLFPTSLSQAQARYQAAKTIYQQIAAEAGGEPPPGPSGSSIFTTQTPSMFENDDSYELGTRFWSDANGQITHARLYTYILEGGNHTVRIWRASNGTLVAGPYTWNITAGTEGWKTFALPTPVSITANTDYIIAISNSTDRYYAEQTQGMASTITSGHLHTYVGSGVYSTTAGAMPAATWQNTNYFRDIVFAPQ